MFRYSPSFLHELALRAASTQLEHEAGVLRDLRWMRNRMQEDSPVTIRSCAHLHRVHDAHIERMNRTEFRVVDPLPFPEPPLAPPCGGLEVVPIRTELDLLQEGREQNNCVGSYASGIRAGIVYVYRVLAPERATLSIVPGGGGRWRLSEIRASHNRPVRPEFAQSAVNWIEQQSLGR